MRKCFVGLKIALPDLFHSQPLKQEPLIHPEDAVVEAFAKTSVAWPLGGDGAGGALRDGTGDIFLLSITEKEECPCGSRLKAHRGTSTSS